MIADRSYDVNRFWRCSQDKADMANGKRVMASQKKRDRIIQTTTHLLLKKGSSSATSTTDICSAARLARPALYHHFGSKRNLRLSVQMDHIEKTLKPYLAEAHSIQVRY
jgi:AcrR family transcriptional regulator